jgi:hypothetical protein
MNKMGMVSLGFSVVRNGKKLKKYENLDKMG